MCQCQLICTSLRCHLTWFEGYAAILAAEAPRMKELLLRNHPIHEEHALAAEVANLVRRDAGTLAAAGRTFSSDGARQERIAPMQAPPAVLVSESQQRRRSYVCTRGRSEAPGLFCLSVQPSCYLELCGSRCSVESFPVPIHLATVFQEAPALITIVSPNSYQSLTVKM